MAIEAVDQLVEARVSNSDSPATGVVLSTYVAADDARRIRERAATADRSVAAEVREALRFYLAAELFPPEGARGS